MNEVARREATREGYTKNNYFPTGFEVKFEGDDVWWLEYENINTGNLAYFN